MSLLDVIGLVVVAVLVDFLCRRHEERICRRIPENSQTGKSFDATLVYHRIQRVRRDYLAVVCARSHDRSRRKELHARIGRTLRCRSYFRRRAMGNPHPAASEAEQGPA
jgi:hypothetical protein